MMRPLYSLVMQAAQPFLRRKLARRGVAEPGYLQAVPERFGDYSQSPPAQAGALWIHAVSLGETRAAAILIAALRARQPGLRLLLTHGTATGRAEGATLLRAGDAQAWQPWDTPQAVARFLSHFRPCAGVLMETEIWPNLAAACKARGLPLALANARLSARSLHGALRVAPLSRPAYASLAAVWAQTDDDAQRLARAGARVTAVVGNLKFDALPDAAQLALSKTWRALSPRPVVMLASSRDGEEAEFFALLKQKEPVARTGRAWAAIDLIANHIQWLVVPRHPQRFDEVEQLARDNGFSVSRRSTWTAGPQPADVWLGDSLGEMALYYGLADVALLGGSFAPLGGQNLIEAAACGCPLVMGPHTFNFAQAAQGSLNAGAALRAATLQDAVHAALALTADRPRAQAMRSAALQFAATHRGAAAATAQAVLSLCATIPDSNPHAPETT